MNRGKDPFFPDGFPKPADRYQGDNGDRRARPAAAPPRQPAPPSFPDPALLIRALRQNIGVGLVIGILAAIICGMTAFRLVPKPQFVAINKLEIKPNKPVLLLESSHERIDYKSFQSAQCQLINDSIVLEAALKKPGIANLPSVKAQSDPVDWLESQFLAKFLEGSQELMEISIKGSRPEELPPLVNAITDAYFDKIVNKDETERLASVKQLKELYEEGEKKLDKRRAEMRKLAELVGSDNGAILAGKHISLSEELRLQKNEKLRTGKELNEYETELNVLMQNAAQGPRAIHPDELEPYFANDTELINLHSLITKEKSKIAKNDRIARKDDPSSRMAKKVIDSTKRAYDERVALLTPMYERKIRNQENEGEGERIVNLQSKIKSTKKYQEQLDQEIETLEADAEIFNRRALDVDVMKTAITRDEESNLKISKEIEALGIETKAPQRVRPVGQRSVKAKQESSAKRNMAIAIAALGAFFGSIFLVAWREYRLRRVDSPKEVVEGLGLKLVGTLPQLPSKQEVGRRALPNPARWQNLLIESIDAARTVLLRDSRHLALRTIMVTSASKGEGKSSLSSHLAISLARTGRRTLLADFDLRSPSAHHLFEIPKGPGTAELLRGEDDVDQVVQHVMTDLDVLTAGFVDAEAIRALGQDALPDLLGRLTDRYDFVVIDTAPVLPVADALLISGHVDAVILSVYRDVSRIPAVMVCKERLESLGVRLLGVVVTGIPVERFGPEYSYAARPESFV